MFCGRFAQAVKDQVLCGQRYSQFAQHLYACTTRNQMQNKPISKAVALDVLVISLAFAACAGGATFLFAEPSVVSVDKVEVSSDTTYPLLVFATGRDVALAYSRRMLGLFGPFVVFSFYKWRTSVGCGLAAVMVVPAAVVLLGFWWEQPATLAEYRAERQHECRCGESPCDKDVVCAPCGLPTIGQ